MTTNKLLVAAVLALAIGAAIVGVVGEMKGQPMTSPGVRVPFLHGLSSGQNAGQGELASLERATAWLNSPPLTPAALRGKVVLIDFWTYTCINWRRAQSYVRAWAEKYKQHGLVVIGVHAPEFPFEKNLDDQGNGTVVEQRMYQLIRQPQPIADRLFEIEFLDSGMEAFAFTFG